MITVLLLDQLTDQTITITHLLKYFNITACPWYQSYKDTLKVLKGIHYWVEFSQSLWVLMYLWRIKFLSIIDFCPYRAKLWAGGVRVRQAGGTCVWVTRVTSRALQIKQNKSDSTTSISGGGESFFTPQSPSQCENSLNCFVQSISPALPPPPQHVYGGWRC